MTVHHPVLIDDVGDEEQIAQVRTALQHDFGTLTTPADLERLAATAYERVASGATVRTFLPLLAEREARHLLQELVSSESLPSD